MCLIIEKNQQPLIAKKDITVFKVVNIHRKESNEIEIHSWMNSPDQIKYKYKVKMNTTLSLTSDTSPLDSVETEKARKKMKEEDFIFIGKGFHFAFTKKRLSSLLYTKFNHYTKFSIILKFLIPKGSKYYIGVDNKLGVSDTIMLIQDPSKLKLS